MTKSNYVDKKYKCEYCKPWYNPKPIIDMPYLFIRLWVMDDMYRYVQIF